MNPGPPHESRPSHPQYLGEFSSGERHGVDAQAEGGIKQGIEGGIKQRVEVGIKQRVEGGIKQRAEGGIPGESDESDTVWRKSGTKPCPAA